jgi:NitT/TauT family transport system substrate-binding protein
MGPAGEGFYGENRMKRSMGRSMLVATGLACVAAFGNAATVAAQPLEKITFLTAAPPNLPAFAAAQIAKGKGYFAQEGFDVQILAGKGGADVAKQVGAGNAEAGYVLGDSPILVRANGVPLKLTAMLGAGSFSFLTTRADSGIKSPADLKGKTVSVLSFQDTATYYALLGAILGAGLQPSDVNIQALGPSGVWQSVAKGDSHACACVADWVVLIRSQGTQVDATPLSKFTPAMSQGLGFSDEMIAKRPKLVQGVTRAVLKAAKEIIDNPDQAALDFVKFVPGWDGKEEAVKQTIRMYAKDVYSGQAKLGMIDADRMSKLQDFYFEQKLIEKKTPIGELYTNAFVQ